MKPGSTSAACVALLRRDLLLVWRRRGDALNPLLFAIIVVALFPFALGPEAAVLSRIAAGTIFVAVLLVKDAGWISLPALGATIIVTHLGLLLWEMKFVAVSLAHPGLKPARS